MMSILKLNELAYQKRYGRPLPEINDKNVNREDLNNRFQIVHHHEVEKALIDSIPDSALVIIIVGFGDGTFIQKYKKQLEEWSKLIIWEPDPTAFLYACSLNEISDVIEEKNVELVVGGDSIAEDELQSVINRSIDYYNLYHCVNLCLPGFKDRYAPYKEKIQGVFGKATMSLRVNVSVRDEYQENFCKNELYAMSVLHKNSTIEFLWKTIPTKDIPVIIVASGPSLNKNMHLLRELRNKALILVASHSAKTLHTNEIPFHFAAVIDPTGGKEYMDYDEKREERMLMSTSAILELQKEYCGRIVYTDLHLGTFPIPGMDPKVYEYSNGGSVAVTLLGMVQRAGFHTVILIGQDLAYADDGSSHVGGEKDGIEHDLWVDGINGKKVRSRSDWVFFLDTIQKSIEVFPETKVVDATEGGALIKGTQVMTMADAIDMYCQTEYPIQEWLDSISGTGELVEKSVFGTIKKQYNVVVSMLELLKKAEELAGNLGEAARLGLLGESEYKDDCLEYDKLYSEVVESDHNELIMYYSEDIVQHYIENAMTIEGDAIVDKRLDLERRLFSGMYKRSVELVKYLREVFPEIEGGEER